MSETYRVRIEYNGRFPLPWSALVYRPGAQAAAEVFFAWTEKGAKRKAEGWIEAEKRHQSYTYEVPA